jgi:DNA-binding NarL/FixJ family response regulator
MRPRLILADDHPMMLAGLRRLLAPGCEVVAEAADGHALLAAAERLRPDLVIADISMPGIDGIEATRRLRASVPGARVLILSVHAEPSFVRAAFAAGACGYLTKAAAADEIELAIRAVLTDRFYVSPEVTRAVVASWQRDAGESTAAVAAVPERDAPEGAALESAMLESAVPAAAAPLTPRQLDIIQLVGQGLGNKEIARQLGVGVATVRTHLARIYEKLRTESRVELALFASRAGRDLGAARVM